MDDLMSNKSSPFLFQDSPEGKDFYVFSKGAYHAPYPYLKNVWNFIEYFSM